MSETTQAHLGVTTSEAGLAHQASRVTVPLSPGAVPVALSKSGRCESGSRSTQYGGSYDGLA